LQHLTLWQIELLPWYAFLIVWALGALRLKSIKVSEPIEARLFTGIVVECAFLLLFSQSWRFGVLGRCMLPESSTVQWLGIAITFVGAAIGIWAPIILGQNWSARVTLKVGHELIRSGPMRMCAIRFIPGSF
jgi:protein-S-isoprenylcysteine O-methyltransferase Ste14